MEALKRWVQTVGVLVGMCALAGAAPPKLQPLTGTAVNSTRFSLPAADHGVVIIHFWASWCLPCRREMPVLDRIARRYPVTVIGIALDTGASRAKIARSANGASFPLALLADTDLSLRGVPSALPETLVYGRDQRLRYRFGVGGMMLSEPVLNRIVPDLLAEASAG